MPTAYLKKISKARNIPIEHLETLWGHAKDAVRSHNKGHDIKSDQWGLTMSIFKTLFRAHHEPKDHPHNLSEPERVAQANRRIQPKHKKPATSSSVNLNHLIETVVSRSQSDEGCEY